MVRDWRKQIAVFNSGKDVSQLRQDGVNDCNLDQHATSFRDNCGRTYAEIIKQILGKEKIQDIDCKKYLPEYLQDYGQEIIKIEPSLAILALMVAPTKDATKETIDVIRKMRETAFDNIFSTLKRQHVPMQKEDLRMICENRDIQMRNFEHNAAYVISMKKQNPEFVRCLLEVVDRCFASNSSYNQKILIQNIPSLLRASQSSRNERLPQLASKTANYTKDEIEALKNVINPQAVERT